MFGLGSLIGGLLGQQEASMVNPLGYQQQFDNYHAQLQAQYQSENYNRQLLAQQANCQRIALFYASCAFGPFQTSYNPFGIIPVDGKEKILSKKKKRKPLKAEAKAQQMLQDLIGVDQWRIYRKTNRVLVNKKHKWIIGNIFGKYNKSEPLCGKPDVLRIDGKNGKGYSATSFCIDPATRNIPYTDKVISYAIHCVDNELDFYHTGNRIGEQKLNKLPECALFIIS